MRWARQIRFRQNPVLAHARLRWYREQTTTYRLATRIVVPVFLRLFARVTVAHGVVLKVRWAFQLPCDSADQIPGSGTDTIRAKIGRHGRFAKTIRFTSYGSDITRSFSGVIAKIATVKVRDAEAIPHYGYCSGSHTFHAARS